MLTGEMSRHTTFRFCLDPTAEHQQVPPRHAGAARFAFNQCLQMVKGALTQRKTDPNVDVLWTGFDLINAFIVQRLEEIRGSGPDVYRRHRWQRWGGDRTAVAGRRVPAGLRRSRRRLRRMLAKGRAKILFAALSRQAGRWWVPLHVEAADLHPSYRHTPRDPSDEGGWVGVDRGLSTFAVAADADGNEVARITDAPKALAAGMKRQRRLARSLSRKQSGSRKRRYAAARLRRHHYHVANVRRHCLHQVSSALVKAHDRLVIETLNVTGMLANRRLARAISDASWAEFSQLLAYEQAWRGGELVAADRWYPSSKLCAACGSIGGDLTLADRVLACSCRYSLDRDTNAAINLTRWGQAHHGLHIDPRTHKQRAGLTTPADGTALTSTPCVPVKPARKKREPTLTPHQRPEPRTPERGGAQHSLELLDTL
ncbi:RNA-guided endonuclease InsQ/TnpB family protein [Candidatus Mycobacterium methanotrophicum]|uniref:Transposase n=1 Tax=Candidatus Mycobacterium methanotrophicum TaxID=2943498 RepID=A0ABY4QI68_9MYCO|nr:RNA-guided endonuclease TnpB family protein [Candidatus Mycobacterium methanotrophicum]UQX10722.1 transposase [Candidatus Mycobacterium methanotrophicum]